MLPIAVLGCDAQRDPALVLDESERHVPAGAALTEVKTARHTVQSVAGDEPGESEIVLDGRVLAAHPGPDDMPLLLDDERAVVFVSARTGVASLWRVDVDGTDLRQLTNIGVKIGAIDPQTFVPPPAWSMAQDGDAVVYDDGSGTMWRVALKTGEVLR